MPRGRTPRAAASAESGGSRLSTLAASSGGGGGAVPGLGRWLTVSLGVVVTVAIVLMAQPTLVTGPARPTAAALAELKVPQKQRDVVALSDERRAQAAQAAAGAAGTAGAAGSAGAAGVAGAGTEATDLGQLPRVLVAVLVTDGARLLPPFVDTVANLHYNMSRLSLVFVDRGSSDTSMEVLQRLQDEYEDMFASFSVRRAEAAEGGGSSRRKSDVNYLAPLHVQRAAARNRLLDATSLDAIDWVLWWDPAVTHVPRSLLYDLLLANRPVVVPHVVSIAGTVDHDSWYEAQPDAVWGRQASPDLASVPIFYGYGDNIGHRLYMNDLAAIVTDPLDMLPLHGVGAYTLLVDAAVFRSGIRFPAVAYKRRLDAEGFGLKANDAGYAVVGLPAYHIGLQLAERSATAEMVLTGVGIGGVVFTLFSLWLCFRHKRPKYHGRPVVSTKAPAPSAI